MPSYRLVKTPVLVLLVAGVIGGASCSSESESGGGCIAQEVKADPTTVRIGSQVGVSGQGFLATCNDTSSNDEPLPTDDPSTDLRIAVVQNGESVVLGTVDAFGEVGSITLTASIPSTLKPGDAQLVVVGTLAKADLKILAGR